MFVLYITHRLIKYKVYIHMDNVSYSTVTSLHLQTYSDTDGMKRRLSPLSASFQQLWLLRHLDDMTATAPVSGVTLSTGVTP